MTVGVVTCLCQPVGRAPLREYIQLHGGLVIATYRCQQVPGSSSGGPVWSTASAVQGSRCYTRLAHTGREWIRVYERWCLCCVWIPCQRQSPVVLQLARNSGIAQCRAHLTWVCRPKPTDLPLLALTPLGGRGRERQVDRLLEGFFFIYWIIR